MNARERGFALLCSHLGDPDRKCLTLAQFRTLAKRVSLMHRPLVQRELALADLKELGYSPELAQRILQLLRQEDQLDWYMQKAAKAGCRILTRLSEGYPPALRSRLGLDAPACLWVKGDPTLLSVPAVCLVGSRVLNVPNEAFAKAVGAQAARQGYVLVSGNARGADTAAQQSCIASGGRVISVVADSLCTRPERENILYLSEDGFDLPFSALRALSRNRIIHALGEKVFVAQCAFGSGGTWDGTQKNLHKGYTPVFCFADGSEAVQALYGMGASGIDEMALQDFSALQPSEYKLF